MLGAPAGRCSLPGTVRHAPGLPPPDGLARPPRLPGGHARTGRGGLVPRRHPAGQAGRLSFDDGYRPQFTFALPELRKHGWAGVLNLKAEGSDLYTSNVKAMIDAGWELAAHTIHHLDLTTLDAAQLKEEVAGSRAILRREYGVPVENFCYPAGRFDATVVAAVEAAGYVGATTEIPGYANRKASPTNWPASRSSAPAASPASPKTCAPAPRAGPGSRRRRGAPWPRAPGRLP